MNKIANTKIILIFLIFSGLFGLAKISEAASISVDAAQTSGAFNKYIDLAQGRRGVFDRFTSNEQSRINAIGTRLVRLDAMLNFVSTAEGVYNWSVLDGNIENVKSTGAEILLTLGNMPEWLADASYGTNTFLQDNPHGLNPPTSYAKWQTLIHDVVRHLNVEKKYGIKYFVVWNEPNHPDTAYRSGLSGYETLYKYTAQAVKAVDSSAKIGGPSASAPGRTWIQELANYCKNNSLPLDLVNWHEYDAALPAKLPSKANEVRSWLNAVGFSNTELVLTEYNAISTWGAAEAEPWQVTRAAGMIAPMHYFGADAGMNKLFFFRVRRPSPTVQGIIQDGGNPVFPQYNTFKMIDMMADNRINATEQMDANGIGVGALASKASGLVTVLIWNYQNAGTASNTADLNISNLPAEFSGKTIRLKRYLMDATHSNVNYNAAKAELEIVEDLVLPAASGVSRTFTLSPNAVSIVVLTPQAGGGDTTPPAAPQGLKVN
jgi:hypothetical protein